MTPTSNQTEQTTGNDTRASYGTDTTHDYGEMYGLDNRIWMGIAAGAAIGIGIMLTRRRSHSPWDRARHIAHRVDSNRGEIAEAGRDLLDRIRVIYEESRKVVEEAQDLWSRGRSLVRSA